jgi:hypothetical protein
LYIMCVVCCSPQLMDSAERLVVHNYRMPCGMLQYNLVLLILNLGLSLHIKMVVQIQVNFLFKICYSLKISIIYS